MCRCLYVILCMLVYAGCELRGSFAGAWSSLAIYVRTYMYIYIYKNIHIKKHTLRILFFWMWVFGFIGQRQLPIFTARLSRGGKKNTEFTDLTSFPLPPLDVRIVFPSSTFTPTRRPRYPVPAGGHFWSVTS